jgi:uncharacterized repeat protein (TIGR01451 family)
MKKLAERLLVLLLSAAGSGMLLAERPPAGPPVHPRAVAEVSMDQPDYAPGSTAGIAGSYFMPNETVALQVLRTDGTPGVGASHEAWTVEANGRGDFLTEWHVCEDDCVGTELQLVAVGQQSGFVATTVFGDGRQNITALTSQGGQFQGWFNLSLLWGGTIQGVNSTYAENNSIPLRFNSSLTPGSKHTLLLKYDFSSGGPSRFFDSLDSYNASVNNANVLAGITGAGNPSQWGIPADATLPNGAQPAGFLTTYNISSVTFGAYSFTNGVKILPVTFTVASGKANLNVVIAYGGHLASASVWGPNNGSSQFPGASTKAYASFDGASDMNVSVNPSTIAASADLALIKTASPEPVRSGGTLVYSLVVTNLGPDAASSVVVTDALPATLSFVSASTSQGSSSGPNPLIFSLGSLNANSSATITITTKVLLSTDGSIVNTATVSSTTLDPVSTNNTASVKSTVIDTNSPVITCPADITVSTSPGLCGAVVNFAATATDDEPNLVLTYSPQPGSFFNKGTTTVTCTATDPNGNSSSCNFHVTVQDTEPPKITCPSDITTNADPGVCAAVVKFVVSASDNCSVASVVCSPPSGSSFPVGTTLVTCTATDSSGNMSSCSFNVTVRDTQPPQLVCPANIITNAAAGTCGATVTFPALSAMDNCDGLVNVQFTPPSGSAFLIGTNLVICSATDSAGNKTNCFFLVIVQDPSNQDWPHALTLNLAPNQGLQQAAIRQCLTSLDQSRWYKFKIQPGSRIFVTLTSLPENYDLVLFKDIGLAFGQLTSADDLAHISAEFAADAFAPSAFSSDAFSPSAFSPSAFSPSAFSPSAFSPSAFSPSAFSPSAFSPSAFSSDAFAPSAFSPSAFSPSAFSPTNFSTLAFSPSAFSTTAFSAAQIQSVLAVSAFDGTAGEGVLADTWDNNSYFYVRVRGRNGVFSPGNPFSLNVFMQTGACGNVSPIALDGSGNPLPASTTTAPAGNYKTLILTDLNRWLGPGPSAAKTSVSTELATLAARPEVAGVIVDVGADPWVSFFNAQADTNFDCPFAKNLVVGAIQNIVNRSRTGNALQYVVLIGDDSVFPYFRFPDEALLGPERNYVPPVKDLTPSQASLQLNYVLNQDVYGSQCNLSLKVTDLPLPDLAVGRLVSTATEVTGMIDAYLSTPAGVVNTPTSSLVTGYDFLADDAQAVTNEFAQGIGVTPDTLICANTNAPSQCWTADDLRQALFSKRHDLIFLAGHFSAIDTLAADYTTHMFAPELAATGIDFRNTIIFSAGCHSGYNIVLNDGIPQVTIEPDWARACAQKQATLVAGTGYQYGDTDFIEYSERLYLDFAEQLRTGIGPVSVGQALLNAKHIYLATTPEIRGIHAKSYLEATLFGLPMLSVNMPGSRRTASSISPIVGSVQSIVGNPGGALGLGYADVAVIPTLVPTQIVLNNTSDGAQTIATYLSGGDGIVNNPAEPILPLEVRNVTVGGTVLRGVGFRGGTYTDLPGKVPLTGAPTDTIRGVHATFLSEVFYPMKPWSVNYFGGLCGGIDGLTRLMAIPAQFMSDSPTAATGTIRQFNEMDFRLFYDANIQSFTDANGNVSTPALAAPPSISDILGVTSADGKTVALSAHVVGNPSAGIQAVWVTYTAVNSGTWQSIDLQQDGTDSTLWTGVLQLNGNSQDIRYMVQAVNGVGGVALDTKFGAYHIPDEFDSGRTANLAPTTLTLLPGPTTGAYGTTPTLTAKLTTTSGGTPLAGQRVVFSLSGQQLWSFTDPNGIATAALPLRSMPGTYQLSVLFRGTSQWGPSSTTGSFTITRATTALSVTPKLVYSKTNVNTAIIAQLTDGAGNPIMERTVLFVVNGPNGAYGEPVNTDINGKAPLGKVNLPDGSYSVAVYFNGTIPLPGQNITVDDGIYIPSSANGPTLVLDDVPPVIACSTNIVQSTDPGRCDAVVNYVTTATDPNPGVVLTCTPPSGSVFSKGTNVLNCSATDAAGNTSTCSFLVAVIDTQPPSITCPANIVVPTDPGKPTAVVSFALSATDNCSVVQTNSTPASGSAFPIGTNTVNCVATDASGNQGKCSFTVTVKDIEPPVVSVSASPNVLWPPDHEMIFVTITVVGTDNSGSFTSQITKVTSSDPTNTTGDGSTSGDWFVTGPLTLYLRAERAQVGTGRVYTITIQSTDPSGNVTTSQVTAFVPPSQG